MRVCLGGGLWRTDDGSFEQPEREPDQIAHQTTNPYANAQTDAITDQTTIQATHKDPNRKPNACTDSLAIAEPNIDTDPTNLFR